VTAARIGVFGGSFDPIHNGHLAAASAVQQAMNLDRVLFVPAGDQWQKHLSASAQDRLAMVAVAIDQHPGFEVSDVDVRRSGATYTVDTLKELQSQNPDSNLFFILGTDAAAGLQSWKSPVELLNLAEFVVVTRPGSDFSEPDFAVGRLTRFEFDALDLSSTSMRSKLKSGNTATGEVPESVLDYIQEHNLYKEPR